MLRAGLGPVWMDKRHLHGLDGRRRQRRAARAACCFKSVKGVEMNEISSLVPLLLSYPTIVLSSHLILPGPVTGPDSLISLFLLPLFISSSFTMVIFVMGLISESLLAGALLLSFFVSHMSHFLGTVQTTSLSLLTIKLMYEAGGCNCRKGSPAWLAVLKIYAPLLALSLSIEAGYGVLYSYVSLVLLVRFGSSNLAGKSAPGLGSRLVKALPFVSFAGLYGYGYACGREVQPLMVFVFLGCLGVFSISLKDLLAQDEQAAKLSRTIIFSSGIMAIVLQYLSFNTISSTALSDMLTLLFTVGCAAIASLRDGADHHAHEQAQGHSHSHAHGHSHSEESPSDSIIRQIAMNSDTRSIFSYLMLNTTFMFVQLLYSFRSKSLGLLSDSLHMALDCTSLLLGLIAGVLSKRPPSDKFPFGLKYLETLAGFTNGVLLLGIVCGIFVQAIERLVNPVHIHGTNELLVVATLGLIVNLIGLFAFDHAGHSHGDDNENMRGIFLHILADTLGSVGVVVSTILIKWTHFHVFDPIASIFIGTLVLLSAIPLLRSTASSILLKLDDKKNGLVKTALNQISTTPGITGYTTPRFWTATPQSSGHSHGHSHGHCDHEESLDKHESGHSHAHARTDHCGEHHEHAEKKAASLVGYIHVQFVEGENSTIIKKRVEKIFESVGIDAWIQVESIDSPCWCRPSPVGAPANSTSQLIPN